MLLPFLKISFILISFLHKPALAAQFSSTEGDIILNSQKVRALLNNQQETTATQTIIGNAGGATLKDNAQAIKDTFAPNIAAINAMILQSANIHNDVFGPINISAGIDVPTDDVAGYDKALRQAAFLWLDNAQFVAHAIDLIGGAPIPSISVDQGVNINTVQWQHIVLYLFKIRAH